MMAKDSVKRRLEANAEAGLSFTEFSYQLLQGYDYLHLYREYGCRVQMGGSDQWGNITTGTELIRRIDGGEAFGVTCPLIKKADGTKFGKTEKGNVWLDRRYTSPYTFCQFWLNVSDEDAERFVKIFTSIPLEEIDSLIERHRRLHMSACSSIRLRRSSRSWFMDVRTMSRACRLDRYSLAITRTTSCARCPKSYSRR